MDFLRTAGLACKSGEEEVVRLQAFSSRQPLLTCTELAIFLDYLSIHDRCLFFLLAILIRLSSIYRSIFIYLLVSAT